jgi:hypothetical protein
MSSVLENVSCEQLLTDICKSVDTVNTELIDNMTNNTTTYDLVCIKPNLTYDFFSKQLGKHFEDAVDNLGKHPGSCKSIYSKFETIYETAQLLKTPANISQNTDLNEFMFNTLADTISKMAKTKKFVFSANITETLYNLMNSLENNCQCRLADLFSYILHKYLQVYSTRYVGKTKEEVKELIKKDFEYFVSIVNSLNTQKNIQLKQDEVVNNVAEQLTKVYGFSVESELNRLIPDELGSLKAFFVKVISTYYNKLHPIIWAQIVKYVIENIFKDLPSTPDELFAFFSKSLLLNSGPYILKILQTIRPALSPELRKKYNLTSLKYPLMSPKQVDTILKKVVYNWDMYEINLSVSASVGHVCMVTKATNPETTFVIKMIKPLAIAQSCWEYKTLYNVYEKNTCESEFVKNMLESNGQEMNVQNEIKNVREGFKYYTTNYNEVFGKSVNVKLTAVNVVDGIVKEDSWNTFAMTLAKGTGLNKLIESDVLKTDTKYRAKLHRCIDLLVYKFFQTMISKGYYHGDIHSGNLYFSYIHNVMTLIDFGAVGRIDIFSQDPNIHALVQIIVMSIFYNYDGILDRMTELVNSRCTESKVDTNSDKYKEFKKTLYGHKLDNIRNYAGEKKKYDQYNYDIMSDRRIEDENKTESSTESSYGCNPGQADCPDVTWANKSIYEKLEYIPESKEIVVENKDELPQFTEVLGDAKTITFAKVLELIVTFYATSNINIAIKFNEFAELQKAYVNLMGVLTSVEYNSYRYGMAISKAILSLENLPELRHITLVSKVLKWYVEEKIKYNKLSGSMNKKMDDALVNYKGNCPITNVTQYNIKVTDEYDKPKIERMIVTDLSTQFGGSTHKHLKHIYLNLKEQVDKL